MKYLTLATASGQDYICVSSTPVSDGNLPSDAKCIKLRDKTSTLEGYCPPPGTKMVKENYFDYDSSSNEIVFYQAQADTNCNVIYTNIASISTTQLAPQLELNAQPYSLGSLPVNILYSRYPEDPLDPSYVYRAGTRNIATYSPKQQLSNFMFITPIVNPGVFSSLTSAYVFNLQTGEAKKVSLGVNSPTYTANNIFRKIFYNPYFSYLYEIYAYVDSNDTSHLSIDIYSVSSNGTISYIDNISFLDILPSFHFVASLPLPDSQIFYTIFHTQGSFQLAAIHSSNGLTNWTSTVFSYYISGILSDEIVFDGSKYWAIFEHSGSPYIFWSTDKFNWNSVSGLGDIDFSNNYFVAKVGDYIGFSGSPSYMYHIPSQSFIKMFDFNIDAYVDLNGKIYAVRSFRNPYIWQFIDISTSQTYQKFFPMTAIGSNYLLGENVYVV